MSQTKDKLNIALIFGGRSCEHEVSVTSAKAVLQAIDQQRYNLFFIGVNKQGEWLFSNDFNSLVTDTQVINKANPSTNVSEVVLPAKANSNLISDSPVAEIDVMFSVLHGPFGEDGHMQGLFNMADIAYVGCDLTASAVAMNKAMTKKVLLSANIPQCPHVELSYSQWQEILQSSQQQKFIKQTQEKLGNILFIKPACMGSSIGISKTHNEESLLEAINYAFEFDNTVVIEKALDDYAEIECAILGNGPTKASVLGEIIPNADFYDYETKYINDTTKTKIPADLNAKLTQQIQQSAIDAFAAIDGIGMARIDFLVNKSTGHFVLNEINTLPGFTPISMYPQLWQASGLSYAELINQLISLAIKTHQQKKRLQRIL